MLGPLQARRMHGDKSTCRSIAGNHPHDGFGDFEYGSRLANGGGNGFAGPLSFQLTGTRFTLDDFAEKSTLMAMLRRSSPSTSSAATRKPDWSIAASSAANLRSDVPIPAPLALFAAGLVGIGMLRRVTKKRTQADISL